MLAAVTTNVTIIFLLNTVAKNLVRLQLPVANKGFMVSVIARFNWKKDVGKPGIIKNKTIDGMNGTTKKKARNSSFFTRFDRISTKRKNGMSNNIVILKAAAQPKKKKASFSFFLNM